MGFPHKAEAMSLSACVFVSHGWFGSVVAEEVQYGMSPSSLMFDGGIGAIPRDDAVGLAVPTCGWVSNRKTECSLLLG